MSRDHDPCLEELKVDGVLLGALDQWDAEDVCRRWTIATGDGCTDITFTTTDLSHALVSEPLRPFRFSILRWIDDDGSCDSQVSGGGIWLHDAHALDFLPPDTCPVPGVLSRAKELINGILALPLRNFVRAVLADRHVHNHFWTMPASMRHHHARPGGLALHSVEVAEDMASQGQLTATEHDLGVAAGLLHDIGKVWSYTRDMFPSEQGLAMGHELTGLCRLEPYLRKLEHEWSHGAFAMRVLLSGCGRMRGEGSMPMALLARVRACDQRSCERSAGSPNRLGRSWIPQPYDVPF